MDWYWWIPIGVAIAFFGGPILLLAISTFAGLWGMIIEDFKG